MLDLVPDLDRPEEMLIKVRSYMVLLVQFIIKLVTRESMYKRFKRKMISMDNTHVSVRE